ncbi:MAG: hypothetical protein R2828_32075 [Saprospiraceae bacterium]
MNKALLLLLLLSLEEGRQVYQPLFFSMTTEYEQVTQAQTVFTFPNLDTLLDHPVELLSNKDGAPLLFFSNIMTPVCIDGTCKPMYIDIYWNLVGHYVGYQTVEGQPLSKFDHEDFVAADYQKLHDLLLNDNSILKQKTMSDLFDPEAQAAKAITFNGVEIDAVTGATKKEIKASLVEGALYSCYTIWHLVHGEVGPKMATYLSTIYSADLERYLLYSDYSDYQLFALKYLDEKGMATHLDRILALLEKAPPLTRTYVFKKLPKALWKEETTTNTLYHSFSSLDINSKTLLIQSLPYAHPQSLELLSKQLTQMSKNQLKQYLSHFTKTPSALSNEIRTNLKAIAADPQYVNAYLIQAFLETKTSTE